MSAAHTSGVTACPEKQAHARRDLGATEVGMFIFESRQLAKSGMKFSTDVAVVKSKIISSAVNSGRLLADPPNG